MRPLVPGCPTSATSWRPSVPAFTGIPKKAGFQRNVTQASTDIHRIIDKAIGILNWSWFTINGILNYIL